MLGIVYVSSSSYDMHVSCLTRIWRRETLRKSIVHVSSSSYDMHVSCLTMVCDRIERESSGYKSNFMSVSVLVLCMYPAPHLTCMSVSVLVLCMYPPPHMTCMYPPPHMICMSVSVLVCTFTCARIDNI